MNQLAYFLPHMLALSCSSPFWEGENTGLKSFRSMIFNGVPRTGLPERFASWSEYRRHTETLIDTGVIADTSRIWWDLRPSARYPTLTPRIVGALAQRAGEPTMSSRFEYTWTSERSERTNTAPLGFGRVREPGPGKY